MKYRLRFTTGDTPARLIGDTVALFIIIGGVLAWMWVAP